MGKTGIKSSPSSDGAAQQELPLEQDNKTGISTLSKSTKTTDSQAKGKNTSQGSGKPEAYDESKIKTLSSLEHIRLRSGMYIGRLGDGSNPDDGIYILLKEIIDNSIDEFIMGHGTKIRIQLDDKTLKVRDYGRGIPLGKIVDAVSIINTGAKYNTEVFQFSVGLNGVGTKAVNALSSHFRVVAFRDGLFAEAIFAQGVLKKQNKGKAPKEANGTYVEFIPDPAIFGEYHFDQEFIEQRLWNYAYLNAGLSLYLGSQVFTSQNGLKDLLAAEVDEDHLYDLMHYRGQHLEFAITHTREGYGENYWSFVNGQHTSAGGTHLSAFREGILKGINEFYNKNFTGQDVRDGIAGAVSVKLENPIFESQTKNKLGNTEIRSWIVQEVKTAVDDFLHKNNPASKILLDKILYNENLRKELAVVKKEAKEVAKKIALKIPNLKDCKYHLGEKKYGDETTIFITEGQSASGSMVSSRDVYTQAIFSLRGKPQNMFGKKRAEIYKNEELYNMMMAIGIENSIEGLRYNKIVIATDADYDGFHIRNLLLTFFLSYFEELVAAGHVYILETPLFRVRNKKETRYCYNEKERDEAMAELSNNEVTRFKGLGEISPKEFGQFIGPDIRLVKVDIKTLKTIQETLEFYMGKNTPERRSFIMENLI
jgi:topoisomerase-4 subunit B